MNFTAAGQIIRDARQAQGLTQRRLATSAGLNHTYVSKIENGTLAHAPKLDIIDALSQQLDLNAADRAKLKQHYGKEQLNDWLTSSAFLPDYIG